MGVVSGGGGGGGFSPVSCWLTALVADVKALGSYPFTWNHLADNPWDDNVLAAIPAGLGLAFAFNGTDATITTTVAGTWSFALTGGVVVNAGNTWRATLHDGMAAFATMPPSWGNASEATVSAVYTLPAAAVMAPDILTQTVGDGVLPLAATGQLTIVRLA